MILRGFHGVYSLYLPIPQIFICALPSDSNLAYFTAMPAAMYPSTILGSKR